jgi:hypothetical protein
MITVPVTVLRIVEDYSFVTIFRNKGHNCFRITNEA